jgi:hypothetical protein
MAHTISIDIEFAIWQAAVLVTRHIPRPGKYNIRDIIDETGVNYECWPTHKYGPLDMSRAKSRGNIKLRVTCILAVNGCGSLAPSMFILRHSKSSQEKPDQTIMMATQR